MTQQEATVSSKNKQTNNGSNGDMVSLDAATASVLSELESISSLKQEQRMTLKAFLEEKKMFSFIQSPAKYFSVCLPFS